jgi:FlaA1/EpsC-like NDP-sugar epimerase
VAAAVKNLFPHRRSAILAAHAVLAFGSYVAAWLLRFEFRFDYWEVFLAGLPFLVGVRAFTLAAFRLPDALWEYTSLHDLVALVKAVTLGSLLFTATMVLFYGHGFPRSILILDWVLCIVFLAGIRLAARVLRELHHTEGLRKPRRALIIGAGDAGELLIREIARNNAVNYQVAGLVDDDRAKQGRRIHGIEVLGTVDQLPHLCRSKGVQELLIAMPSIGEKGRRRILEWCRRSGVAFKTVPPLHELLLGRARVSQLEDVRPEDLLEREAVRLDLDHLKRELRGRRILVTGAAGSIGTELCRQLAAFKPEILVCFDRAESSLYFLDQELRQATRDVQIVPTIGDILDQARVDEVFKAYRPDFVYHAAAYKHVPLMEEHPLQAIANNVFGTEAIASTARQFGVKKVVLISTDKAVNPVGVMGMTKRVAEGLVQAYNGPSTALATVRFGNVLGSDGSVLPVFQWQIARGGPVTVTDPVATRYFMLLSEAAQLILQAAAMASGGEVFCLDMGEPVCIRDLAGNLIRLSGLELGRDIEIRTTGLRPGERLTEALVADAEEVLPTSHKRVLMIRKRVLRPEAFLRDLKELRHLVTMRDREGAVAQLKAMAARY